ncbi:MULTISPECIES: JAB domain-containing protein [Apibacter]|uniref:JAB domain-containing protein n=1 Tax=Apibacter TaxID=1778601 RepID=UPI001C6A424C|nr:MULTISPECIES: JAB domain-containing protein [Apibacter]QYN51649.1 JAB domain-containing protein [Apibacter sp. ESL0404]
MKVSEIKVSYTNKNPEKIKIENSNQLYELAISIWNNKNIELQEEVKVLYLNRNNIVLGYYSLAKGGISACLVDIRIILSVALKANASAIVVIHNHLSSNPNPSKSDWDLTERIQQACKLLDLIFVDHLVITKETYFSFADKGFFL